MEKFKTLIMSAPILKIFDANLPTKLKIDASSEGLGALLEQNNDNKIFVPCLTRLQENICTN